MFENIRTITLLSSVKKYLTPKENFVDFERWIRIIHYCNIVITEMLFETSVQIQRSKSAQIETNQPIRIKDLLPGLRMAQACTERSFRKNFPNKTDGRSQSCFLK